jgi:Zn-dependent protease with chaperone function
MKRIALFLLTNIGVLIVLSISMHLLGLGSFFTADYGLDLGNLLVFAAVLAELVLAFLASAVVMWFSRKREYRADAGAAALAPICISMARRRNPDATWDTSSFTRRMTRV